MQEDIIVIWKCNTCLTMLQCMFGTANHPQQEFHINISPSILWKPAPITLQIYLGFWIYIQLDLYCRAGENMQLVEGNTSHRISQTLPKQLYLHIIHIWHRHLKISYRCSQYSLQIQGERKCIFYLSPSFCLREKTIYSYQT